MKLQGFTLIELLVAVGIMTIVTGIGLTRIGAFGTEKQVAEEANKLAADLRWARSGAQNGLHAGDCALDKEYDGIRVTVGAGSYTIEVECEGVVVKSWQKNFGSGVTCTSGGNVIFNPVIHRGPDAGRNFTLNKGVVNYQINVDTDGAIKITEL